MAKQTINVGTTANDKKGDSLRAAFQKVNANFTELYATSTVTFPSQTGNAGKYLTTNGSALSWGTVTVPTDVSQLTDTTNLIPSDVSDLTDTTNLLTSIEATVTIGATPPTGASGRLWYDTISGRMYIYYSGAWVDANP
jgi:hypothetical protein